MRKKEKEGKKLEDLMVSDWLDPLTFSFPFALPNP